MHPTPVAVWAAEVEIASSLAHPTLIRAADRAPAQRRHRSRLLSQRAQFRCTSGLRHLRIRREYILIWPSARPIQTLGPPRCWTSRVDRRRRMLLSAVSLPAPSHPGLGLNAGGSDATNPNLRSNIEVGNPYTGSNACSLVSQLESDVSAYNKGTKVTYNFSAIGFGYNSNSFTYTLDNQVGLLKYFGSPLNPFGTPIPWIPGWGKLVPGL